MRLISFIFLVSKRSIKKNLHFFRCYKNRWYIWSCIIYTFFQILVQLVIAQAKLKQKSVLLEDITDIKDLKKIFRTKNNVLILFTSNSKESQNVIKVFDEAAEQVKGLATAILIDCSLR